MSDNSDEVIPPAPPALGPGDDDPRSPVRVRDEAPTQAPLGPGDADPRSREAGQAGVASEPPKPGELVGENPHDGFEFVAPAAAGPGSAHTGPRQLVRVPVKSTTVNAAPDIQPAKEKE